MRFRDGSTNKQEARLQVAKMKMLRFFMEVNRMHKIKPLRMSHTRLVWFRCAEEGEWIYWTNNVEYESPRQEEKRN